jgi:hypothetical protein
VKNFHARLQIINRDVNYITEQFRFFPAEVTEAAEIIDKINIQTDLKPASIYYYFDE